jgi:cytochrome c oxidase assembly protein Cox11
VQIDAARQAFNFLSGAIPTLGQNFEADGVDLGGLGGDPSDSEGSVGKTQFVEWINTSITVWNKSTGMLESGPVPGSQLFAVLGPTNDCVTTNDGDPIALYDKAAQRWILAQFAVGKNTTSHPSSECVAVSATSDATGNYHLYQFTYSNFDDYPKIGVWSDKYLINYNMFAPPTMAGGAPGNFVADEMCAFDRANMLAGNPAKQACASIPFSPTTGGEFTLLPSDVDGSTPPPGGEGGFFLDVFDSADLHLYTVTSANYSTGVLSLSGPTTISVTPFTFPCNGGRTCIPQNDGGANPLDSLGDRLMYRLAYRNFGNHETLMASHTVDVTGTGTGQTGVRWYEIRNPAGTPSVFQTGTFAPADSKYRWMSSVAMDKNGDIAAGYSVSSTTSDPSIFIATRAPSDSAGTLGNETLIQTGTGATQVDSRWGDYSALTVDPGDDCTMWYINQYLTTSGQFNWNTRIASFTMAGCGNASQFQLSAPASIGAAAPFSITVTAQTASNTTFTGYSGTVHFTSSDPQAVLPADYTFVPSDQGVHTFTGVLLGTLGAQSITATDRSSTAITGSASVTVVPGAASHFQVTTSPTSSIAGQSVSFTVTALDPFNNTATGYSGTVHFTSSDPQATSGSGLPVDYTFVPSTDHGMHTFTNGATLKTSGSISLIATDTVNTSITGNATVNVIPANAATLVITLPPTGSVCSPPCSFNMTVQAMDTFGNIATGYRGTVGFTPSGGPTINAIPNYTFQAADQGQHLFSVSVQSTSSTGTLTITATDTVMSSITGSASLTITSDAPISVVGGRTLRMFRQTVPLIVATGSYGGSGTLSASIDWGDGNLTSNIPVSSGNFVITGSHTYARKGRFAVKVTITSTVSGNPGSIAVATDTASFLPRNYSY